MSRSVEAQEVWISPAALQRRVEVLARYEDFDNQQYRIEELYRTSARGYALIVNGVASTLTEKEAFDWLLSHGREDIHLDIMLDRISDVKSAYA